MVDGLEKRNLVFRMKDKKDRRQKQVYLTPKGKAMEQNLMPLGLSNIKHAQAGISSKELEVCKEVLLKIFKNLTS